MNTNQPNNALAPIVYGILVVLALAIGIITFGNQAGWWSIDF